MEGGILAVPHRIKKFVIIVCKNVKDLKLT